MTVENTKRLIVYQGNGSATEFPYDFLIPDADAAVVTLYDAATNVIIAELDPAEYSITGLGDPEGGEVQYPLVGDPLPSTRKIVIERQQPYVQTLAIPNQSSFFPNEIEGQLDRIVMQTQQLAEQLERTITLPPTATVASIEELTAGVLTLTEIEADISTVAGNAGNVTAVANDLTGANTIGTVAGNIANVNTVAGLSADVTTVAGISADVTTVAGVSTDVAALGPLDTQIATLALIDADITTVAANDANVITVAASIANVNSVGNNIAAVLAVEANEADISTVAADLTTTDTIGTVAGSIAAVNSVSVNMPAVVAVNDNATDISAVAAIAADVSSVAAIDGDVSAVAGVSASIPTVAAVDAEITTAAGISAAISTVAGISSDVSTVAANAANVTAVAGNATNINAAVANEANINAAPQAALDAASARDLAQRWANENEDVPVEGGEFSAYHWSKKAKEFSTGASDNITNQSSVPGANVSEALDQLLNDKLNVDASNVGDATARAAFRSAIGIENRGYFSKADPRAVAFTRTGNGTVSIKAGTIIEVDGEIFTYTSAEPVTMPTLTDGTDYAIWIGPDGQPVATTDFIVPPVANSRLVGGFHYAPGGNATAFDTGGDTTPQINPYSLWDLKFRPACPDPRGMALVADTFWCDIYLLGVDHHVNGTSKYNVTIADNNAPPKVPVMFGGNGSSAYGSFNWWEAAEVMMSHGKELLNYAEFAAMAYGVKEAQSAGTGNDPVSTILRAEYTSKWGIMLATGNMHVWSRDFSYSSDGTTNFSWGAITGGRGSIHKQGTQGLVVALYGGNWTTTGNSGSRSSNWKGGPSDPSLTVSARGRSDHLNQL